MNPSDLLRLLLLAAIWGGSFLFMRIAAPEFARFPLIFLQERLEPGAWLSAATILAGTALAARKPAPPPSPNRHFW